MKILRATVVAVSLFFTLIHLQAQKITVLDEQSLEPLPFAHIQCTGIAEGGQTDISGTFEVGNLNCDSIVITYIGFNDLTIATPKSDRIIFMTTANMDVEVVVISANHWEEDERTISNHILKIQGKSLRNFNPQTSADILSNTGGIYVQKSQQGGGSPMIRGFAANRILLSVDGVRMNNAIFRSGNLQNIITLDPNFIEEGEVLFGPGTVLYGSDAIGGVIDYHLLDAPFNDSFYQKGVVSLRGATANKFGNAHFQYKAGSKKWSAVLSASISHFDDVKMGQFGPDSYLQPYYATRVNDRDTVLPNLDPRVQKPSGYDQFNVYGRFNLKLGKGVLSASSIYSTSSNIPRYDRLIRGNGKELDYAIWQYGPQKWFSQSIGYTLKAEKLLFSNLEAKVNFQTYEESRLSRKLNDNSLRVQVEKPRQFTVYLKLEKQLPSDYTLFYGIEANLNTVKSSASLISIRDGEGRNDRSRYPASSSMNLYGLYAALKKGFNKRHYLNLGLRYSKVQTTATDFQLDLPGTENFNSNAKALNGSIGMTSNWTSKWRTFINLGSGFRAPNIDDLGKVFDSEPGFVTIPNPNLKPEYAYNAELGIRFGQSKHLVIDVGLYYTQLMGAMVRRTSQFQGSDTLFYEGQWSQINTIQNAARAQVYGAWLDVKWQLTRELEFGGIANFQRGQEEDDAGNIGPLRHAGPSNLRLFLLYRIKQLRLTLDQRVSASVPYSRLALSERNKAYIYDSDAFGRPYSSGWSTVNFYGEYAWNKRLQTSIGLENLFNRRYRPYSSGIVAAGFNASMQIRFLF